jgi:hypothetical protein
MLDHSFPSRESDLLHYEHSRRALRQFQLLREAI